ncbi:MAG: [FeFe] hydrogenase H-cluster radical SAM maturase HydG [Bacteriovoracaceae bacterium]|nr:[FeFe] hydrogenase H-cluster radical SAM maturase HydG [Bacteriovoracaceae bacterium]
MMNNYKFIDDKKIHSLLNDAKIPDDGRAYDILRKGRELKGLDSGEIFDLLNVKDSKIKNEIFKVAKYVKQEIYGKRLVLFAPFYVSNYCQNECTYCAYRSQNGGLIRKKLDEEEIIEETKMLLKDGHKRVLLVAGETHSDRDLDFVMESIDTIYGVRDGTQNIRRINVNIAPLSVWQFKRLERCKIGTYQIFQETYHEETYGKVHLKGPKSNYNFRLETIDRAFKAGIDDVGIGVLFGLYDWKYEVLAMVEHIRHLEHQFGVGPHTISVPRIEPALNSPISKNPPFVVNDEDFKLIISVLRIAIPYTGIILSTRENEKVRREAFELGVSQISAGSKTNPGGYNERDKHNADNLEQFSLGDTRSTSEVIKDIVQCGYIPSFCTGCYRKGRVGNDFMDLAIPGLIKEHCIPNGIFTFAEYIHDFGDRSLKKEGRELIDKMLVEIQNEQLQDKVRDKLSLISDGKRDIFF